MSSNLSTNQEGQARGDKAVTTVTVVREVSVPPVGEHSDSISNEDESETEKIYALPISWKGEKLIMNVAETDTVGDLKALIYSVTWVPPVRQKLIGFVKGQLPSDEIPLQPYLSQLSHKKGGALTLIGTPEGQELRKLDDVPDVKNSELDVDYTQAEASEGAHKQEKRNKRKLAEAIEKVEINIIAPPRQGKKLLVLDLDYTILDCKLWNDQTRSTQEFARPYLAEFLEAVYPYYDVVIWSQTSWRWLENKLIELGMIGGDLLCHIPFVLDRAPMFSIYSVRHGKPFKHEVKALDIIWKRFPDVYNERNTIHVDDLGRNFAMNPSCGLKIKGYKDASRNRATDKELIYVARYLLMIASLPDFSTLNHSKSDWKAYNGPLPDGVVDPVISFPQSHR